MALYPARADATCIRLLAQLAQVHVSAIDDWPTDFLDYILSEKVAPKTAKHITIQTHLSRFPVAGRAAWAAAH